MKTKQPTIIKYIEAASEIVALANKRKSVMIKQGYIWGRTPAAFIQNWQFRIVMNMIYEKRIAHYTLKPSTKKYGKT